MKSPGSREVHTVKKGRGAQRTGQHIKREVEIKSPGSRHVDDTVKDERGAQRTHNVR
jgi:hypothetical protein